MAVNPKGPNSDSDINKFSQAAESVVNNTFGGLGKISVKDVLGATFYENRTDKKISEAILLDSLIKNLDTPILKGLAQDCVVVLSNWFEDPEILCCLVQGIWAMYAASHNGSLADFQKNGIGIADTKFGKWLDVIIALVDLIITFLSSDVRKIAVMIPDLVKEIMNGVIGAILLVLQEVLFAIRDSVINTILNAIDRNANGTLSMSNIWAKCLPFAQLLEVLKKYIHDYGLFAELFEKIKGFVAGLVGDFGYFKQLDFPKNVKDLEFLYWFRDLLLKLKQASLNFDLCVLYGASTAGTRDNGGALGDGNVLPSGLGKTGAPPSDNYEASQGIKVAADGTILQNTETQQTQRDNTVPILSNSSIRTFLNKYYGYPLDIVDNILTRSNSADSIKGTDINSTQFSNLNADCPNSPNPEEIVRWALSIRNRNL